MKMKALLTAYCQTDQQEKWEEVLKEETFFDLTFSYPKSNTLKISGKTDTGIEYSKELTELTIENLESVIYEVEQFLGEKLAKELDTKINANRKTLKSAAPKEKKIIRHENKKLNDMIKKVITEVFHYEPD